MIGDAKSDSVARDVGGMILSYYVPVLGWAYGAVRATEGAKTSKKATQGFINHDQATIARIRIEQLRLKQQQKMVQDLAIMKASADAGESAKSPEWRNYVAWIGGLAILGVGVLYLTRREAIPRKS